MPIASRFSVIPGVQGPMDPGSPLRSGLYDEKAFFDK